MVTENPSWRTMRVTLLDRTQLAFGPIAANPWCLIDIFTADGSVFLTIKQHGARNTFKFSADQSSIIAKELETVANWPGVGKLIAQMEQTKTNHQSPSDNSWRFLGALRGWITRLSYWSWLRWQGVEYSSQSIIMDSNRTLSIQVSRNRIYLRFSMPGEELVIQIHPHMAPTISLGLQQAIGLQTKSQLQHNRD